MTGSVDLTRTFAAPPAVVWAMWTDPEQLKAWFGPDGVSIPSVVLDLRVGGPRRLCMAMDGRQMWFAGNFLEVERPSWLVWTESLADAEGNVLSAASMGMPPGFPDVTTVTLTLTAVDGGTLLHLVHEGVPADSPGASGWTMAFAKLDAHLV